MDGSKKTRVLTEAELTKLADNSRHAAAALKRHNEIRDRSGKPVITHSEFNGYRVFDDLGVGPAS